MIVLESVAHAKLNLTLAILGKRPDGYHDLEMVMQEISLGDTVRLTLGTGAPWEILCTSTQVPSDSSNICWKAAELFFHEIGAD